MNQYPITEADLHAYVDGLLPATRCAEIESYLAARPDEAARVAAYRTQNAALRSLFNPVLDEPVPERLSARPRRPWAWQRLAAGFAIAAVSGTAGWALHGETQNGSALAGLAGTAMHADAHIDPLAQQAAVAHVVYAPDVRRPVEIGAEQEDQLVAWLSKRIGTRIRPPKLGKLGYELVGGRLLPGNSGPVAQFMYHNVAGERLTLYVSTEQEKNRDTGFRFAREGPVNVFYWIDGKFGYALSAGIGKAELARVSAAVYEQLQKPS